MAVIKQQPILSVPGQDTNIGFPGSEVFHRAKSGDTGGVFSAVELVTQPGQGVQVHVHDHEDELVYVVEGEIEVTLGDQKMTATVGILALLPRGIPHGFTNVGNRPSRVLDVILPGSFDNYFVELHNLYDSSGQADEAKLNALAERYGIRYL
jgi:quercetin dioxygenase-like cupin family protein